MLGLTRQERGAMLYGEYMDLVAVYQIKHEGAKLALPFDDEEAIPDIP